MKKLSSLVLAFLLAAFFMLTVAAGDSTHLMTHGSKDQDALIVGKVTEIADDYIMFDIIRTVSGTPASSPFKLLTVDGYRYNDDIDFIVDDGILVSVKFSDTSKSAGTVVFGIYKVTLMQDKKIKMDINDYDVGFIEWVVNTGLEDSLYCEGDKVFRHTGKGDWQSDGELLFDGTVWHKDSLDPKYSAPEVAVAVIGCPASPNVLKIIRILRWIMIPAIVIATIIIIIVLRKRRHI